MRILAIAIVILLSSCMRPAVESIATRPPASVETANLSVADLRAKIEEQHRKIDDAKQQIYGMDQQLKRAQTERVKIWLGLIAGVFGLAFALCMAAAYWLPGIRMQCFKAAAFCMVGAVGCLVAIKLAPYRLWIELGIAGIVVIVAAIYLVRHSYHYQNPEL